MVELVKDLAFKLRVLRDLLGGAFYEWRKDVWSRDLDALFCCDGRECGCGGSTIRDVWAWNVGRTNHG